MIFENMDLILGIGLAIGIVFCLTVLYFFKYQDYMKDHPDKEVKFEVKYVVAAVCSLAAAGLASYIITFLGLGYVAPGTVITEPAIGFICALAIGGFVTFVIDACIFHPIVDGTAAMAINKAQAKIREEAVSSATQERIKNAVAIKAQSLGLVDEAKIAALTKMVSDENDPSLPAYVQLLLK